MIAKVRRAGEILNEQGISELHRHARWYLKRKINHFHGGYYHEIKRSDNKERWSLIESALDRDDLSALDIGCADGFFSAKLANKGMFSIGIDHTSKRVKSASQKHRGESCAFIEFSLNENNVDRLPETSVSLVLTVYHHWVKAYGSQGAKGILNTLAEKNDKIFFELPKKLNEIDDDWGFEVEKEEDETYVEMHERYIQSLLEGSDVEFLGETEYVSEVERTDLLFVLKTDNI